MIRRGLIACALSCTLVACDDDSALALKAKENEAVGRLVTEYLDPHNWETRREKRRQLIGQAEAAAPFLWRATDTDYFEHLHLTLKILQDIRAYDNDVWNERRQTLRQRVLKALARDPALHDLPGLFNQLSLIGESEDIQALTPFFKAVSPQTRELALATAYRLGLPYQGGDPLAVSDAARVWTLQEASLLEREDRLWDHLATADHDVYRQVLVEGLIHCLVARPGKNRARAGNIWVRARDEKDPNVRVQLVVLLGVLGDPRLQGPLIESRWLNSSDPALKYATSWSLNELGFPNPQPRR